VPGQAEALAPDLLGEFDRILQSTAEIKRQQVTKLKSIGKAEQFGLGMPGFCHQSCLASRLRCYESGVDHVRIQLADALEALGDDAPSCRADLLRRVDRGRPDPNHLFGAYVQERVRTSFGLLHRA